MAEEEYKVGFVSGAKTEFLLPPLLVRFRVKTKQYLIAIMAFIATIGFIQLIYPAHAFVDGIKTENWPMAVVFDPKTNLTYIANERSNIVSVVGASGKIIDNVSVGTFPVSMIYNSKNNAIYVANERSNTISVIDTTTNSVVDNMLVGKHPDGLASDGAMLFVANSGNDTLSVIDLNKDEVVRTIVVGHLPAGVSVYPVNDKVKKIYVANTGSNTVSVIVLNSTLQKPEFNLKNIPLNGTSPFGIAVDIHEKMVYVTNTDSDSVSVISTTNDIETQKVNVGQNPLGVAVDIHNHKVYVANFLSKTVSVINRTRDGSFNVTKIPVSCCPTDVRVIAPPTRHGGKYMVYVPNALSDSMSIINSNTNQVQIGLMLNVNPPDSGYITCNDKKNDIGTSNNKYLTYDNGTILTCTAVGKSEDFQSTHQIIVSELISLYHFISNELLQTSEFKFIGWSSYGHVIPSSGVKEHKITFTPSHYDTVTANFEEHTPIKLDFLAALFTIIAGLPVVATFMTRFYSDRHKKLLERYSKAIEDSKGNNEHLSDLKKMIVDLYTKRKISEQDYSVLKEKFEEVNA